MRYFGNMYHFVSFRLLKMKINPLFHSSHLLPPYRSFTATGCPSVTLRAREEASPLFLQFPCSWCTCKHRNAFSNRLYIKFCPVSRHSCSHPTETVLTRHDPSSKHLPSAGPVLLHKESVLLCHRNLEKLVHLCMDGI